jgi:hypothetical protein
MEGPNLAFRARNDKQLCLAHVLAKRLHTVLRGNDSFVLDEDFPLKAQQR